MPVNELPVEPEPDPRLDRFRSQVRAATGASDRMPLRVLVLFVIAAASMVAAPIPFNVIGAAAVALLALDAASHRR